MSTLLFHASILDRATIAAIGILAATGSAGVLRSALRAARVDPLVALRAE
jgi:hypothetical protein